MHFWLKECLPSVDQKRSIFFQLLRGIEYLHASAIIHADIKLENCFMRSSAQDTEAVIGDFDISKDVEARTLTRMTNTTTAVGGTAGYLAPELRCQPNGKRANPSPAADMWAMGMLIFYSLQPIESYHELVHAEPATVDTLIQQMDESQRTVLASLLAKDATQRQTAPHALHQPFIAVQQRVTELRLQQANDAAEAAAREQLLCHQRELARDQAAKHHAELEETKLKLLAQPPGYWNNLDPGSVAIMHTRYMEARLQAKMQDYIFNFEGRNHANEACGASLKNIVVTRVQRVENLTLWKNYQRTKEALKEKMDRHAHRPKQLCKAPSMHLTPEDIIDSDINEFWLFHGTNATAANTIAHAGFDERVANMNGMYGAGACALLGVSKG